ncbi:MAG: sigma-70 family RNA polymerase sigma factor [Myxococcota bacterium]
MTVDVDDYYRRYGPMVLRRCRTLLRNEEDARDALQETFIKLVRYQDRLEDRAPSSLLYRMATHVCLNRIRAKRRRPAEPNAELIERIAEIRDGEEQSIASNALRRIFGDEQESTRVMAVLHLLDGMTLEEVAEEVGMSVSGVRKRLRGLKKRVQELREVEL